MAGLMAARSVKANRLAGRALGFTWLLLALGGSGDARAESAIPEVTVSAEMGADRSRKEIVLDLPFLRALPQTAFDARNPWLPGVHRFEGVAFAVLMEQLQVRAQAVRIVALDDYAVTIPLENVVSDPAVLVHSLDGSAMNVRNKGPLWLVYPEAGEGERYGQHPYADYMVWQIKRIEFH